MLVGPSLLLLGWVRQTATSATNVSVANLNSGGNRGLADLLIPAFSVVGGFEEKPAIQITRNQV